MKKKISRILVIIFFSLLLLDVVALSIGQQAIHVWTKPLLMPVLASFLISEMSGNASNAWFFTLIGIFLAWSGDIFLLFEKNNPSFFLFGLASFLGTHICYIFLFKKLIKKSINWWTKNAWLWLAVCFYGIILIAILWKSLGGMKIPVIFYALCISLMVILSLRLQPDMPKKVWVYFSIGAFLFFISDSILALNKFHQPVHFASPAIMFTYGLAQYLITVGTVKYFVSAIADEG